MRFWMSVLCVLLLSPVAARADSAVLRVQVVSRPSETVPIPVGAQRVTMVTVKFTASCAKDISLEALKLHHKGLGAPSDIARVYASVENVRRTRTSLVNRDRVATVPFRKFVVPACGTATVDILADISADAAVTGQHMLELTSEKDIVTDASVSVVLEPPGVQTVAIPVGKAVGSVSVEPLSIPDLKYGSSRMVARVRLRADAKYDQEISAITFTNEGSARDGDLQNLVLKSAGHTIFSPIVPALDGDRIRIVLDPPLVLRRNEQRVVELRADIRATRRRTVKFVIQEPSDVEAAMARRR